jgi:uncharacterized MnhB-related membrane protein
MNEIVDVIMLTLVVILAIVALNIRDLLAAVVAFGAFSFSMCVLWTEMGAVDVAFTEAAVGAGVSTIFMLGAVFRTSRRTKD